MMVASRNTRVILGFVSGLLLTLCGFAAGQQIPTLPPQPKAERAKPPERLRYDAKEKELTVDPGQSSITFTFAVTNVSKQPVIVNGVRTSCGCTVAKLPASPWTLKPGDHGEIAIEVDVRHKRGTLTKTAAVSTDGGFDLLVVKVHIPVTNFADNSMRTGDRTLNMRIAAADRQAVFRNQCADCHLKPALGKQGKALYTAACAICHDAEHRATMVPDLHALPHPTTEDYWRTWITRGKPGSLMPAFAREEGGFLSGSQIDSLVNYLTRTLSDTHKAHPEGKPDSSIDQGAPLIPPLFPGPDASSPDLPAPSGTAAPLAAGQ